MKTLCELARHSQGSNTTQTASANNSQMFIKVSTPMDMQDRAGIAAARQKAHN